jgi:hypothetical protein
MEKYLETNGSAENMFLTEFNMDAAKRIWRKEGLGRRHYRKNRRVMR